MGSYDKSNWVVLVVLKLFSYIYFTNKNESNLKDYNLFTYVDSAAKDKTIHFMLIYRLSKALHLLVMFCFN